MVTFISPELRDRLKSIVRFAVEQFGDKLNKEQKEFVLVSVTKFICSLATEDGKIMAEAFRKLANKEPGWDGDAGKGLIMQGEVAIKIPDKLQVGPFKLCEFASQKLSKADQAELEKALAHAQKFSEKECVLRKYHVRMETKGSAVQSLLPRGYSFEKTEQALAALIAFFLEQAVSKEGALLNDGNKNVLFTKWRGFVSAIIITPTIDKKWEFTIKAPGTISIAPADLIFSLS